MVLVFGFGGLDVREEAKTFFLVVVAIFSLLVCRTPRTTMKTQTRNTEVANERACAYVRFSSGPVGWVGGEEAGEGKQRGKRKMPKKNAK